MKTSNQHLWVFATLEPQKLETTQHLLLMAIQCYCNLNEINHWEKREGYLISNQNTIGTEPLTAVQSVLAFILFFYLIITVANHLVSLNSIKRRKKQYHICFWAELLLLREQTVQGAITINQLEVARTRYTVFCAIVM